MSDDNPEVSSDGQNELESDVGTRRECFVIAPIGSPGTDIRKRTDGIVEEAIRPILEKEYNYEVTIAHEIAETGSIPHQVITRLLSADLVIADLTGRNPNVMYELAVRHATGKPVIPIDNEDESLPFDVATERTIPYEDAIHGPTQLKKSLRKAVEEVDDDHEADNPIYRAQKIEEVRGALGGYVRNAIEGEEGERLGDLIEQMMDQLDEIKRSASGSKGIGTGLHLKAAGEIEAHSNHIDHDVLFVDGSVRAGGKISAGPGGLFKSVEAFWSPNDTQSERKNVRHDSGS